MSMMPTLQLRIASGFDLEGFREIVDDLQASGTSVELEQRPREGPWAFLEVLIPAAVVLWVLKPYVQEFSKETGKLHAGALHKGLGKLWNKAFGPDPEIDYKLVGSSGKIKTTGFSHAVSIMADRNDHGKVKLVFAPETTSEDFRLATDQFISMMAEHYDAPGHDPLSRTMESISYLAHPNFEAVVYLNPLTKALELIDYVESSRLRNLIAHPIA